MVHVKDPIFINLDEEMDKNDVHVNNADGNNLNDEYELVDVDNKSSKQFQNH